MALPRSCSCGSIHQPGERCAVAQRRYEKRRGTKTDRGYGGKWAKTSARIQRRDNFECQLRLAGCTGRSETADHIVPKIRGGTDDDDNLQAACRHCNSKKRDRSSR